ncbi:MAG: Clp protease N-terminal domain-containing protein [Chloroflexota bacterium]
MPDGRERLTPRVRRVLAMAEDEAVALRQSEIGTEHVLLGLMREGRGLATRALRELGVDPPELAQRIRARLVPAAFGPDGPIQPGPGVRGALEMARAEAVRLHHDYVGTEHLLLGLLRDGEGPAFVTLAGVGVTLARARQQVIKLMNESTPELPGGRASGLAILRGRGRAVDRVPDYGPDDPYENDPDRCQHCGRTRRPDWRFCVYCGEQRPGCCERCGAPTPTLAGVRFCPGCGVMLAQGEPV